MQNIALKIQALIIAGISGSITPEEKEILDQLITEHPEMYDTLSTSLHEVLDAEKLDMERTGYTRPSVEPIIAILKAKQKSRIRKLVITPAACLLGVCLLTALLYYTSGKKPEHNIAAANNKEVHLLIGEKSINLPDKGKINSDSIALLLNNKVTLIDADTGTLVVPPGKQFEMVLNDGSIVSMNSASSMSFPVMFTGKREITLSGEAYVKVTKSPEQPFIVHTLKGKVEVLGTEFNVNTYQENRPSFSLVNGSIKIISEKDSVQLKPGFAGTLTDEKIEVGPFDIDKVTAWRNGVIILPNTTIEEMAITILPRYFDEKVVIDKTAQGKQCVFAFDRNTPFKDIMEDYAKINDLRLYKAADSLYHLK
jgi:hypothetical protein